MAAPPTGTVTFLFTDIEGSTQLLHALGERYRSVQERHCEIIRAAIGAWHGHLVRTEGDSFFMTFPSAIDAVRTAVAAQRKLTGNDWPAGSDLRVRMGLHTGQGVVGGDDYIGIAVNTAARIASAAHGGQVLLSEPTRALVQHDLPAGVALRDLGEHRLKDIVHPERLFDFVIDGLPSDFPPIRTHDARPNNLPLQPTSFVGRSDEIAQAIQLLNDHRLVTLTGPGGSGKTRLALEVASKVLPRFDDGVFFVDFSALSDHVQVPSGVAQALGIREEAGRELVDTLADQLSTQGVLLVLDNFEHVLPAVPVVERLLSAAVGYGSSLPAGLRCVSTGSRNSRFRRWRCPIPAMRARSRSGPGARRSRCSTTAPAPPGRSSASPRGTPRLWPASARAWTGCRWPSSLPRAESRC
jgi:class 3 adenylate cyclase